MALLTHAHAFDHADDTTLSAALQRFGADVEAMRFEAIDQARPPGIYAMLTARTGQSEEQLRSSLVNLLSSLNEDTRIIDISFDTAATAIETTQQGTDYAFVPTTIVMSEGPGPDITVERTTFALQDTGVWYFFQLEGQADFQIIQQAYSEFENITPPN